jgi:dihydrolipoamide dehydrogenase
MLAHVATREGIAAVNNMAGRSDRIRYDAIPSVIYTHPEVASAGRTETELEAASVKYTKTVVPMGVAGRFLIENEHGSGFLKLLTGAEYGEILGVHAVADFSSEFIVAGSALIESELPASDAAEIVFPHPTISEALGEALRRAQQGRQP